MDPFLGEIRIFPFGYAPSGWLPCEGQQLQVNQYVALHALIGNTYGGNLQTVFNLPDLRGRSPLHYGAYSDTSGSVMYQPGNATGQQTVTLTVNQIPAHYHELQALNTEGTTTAPVNASSGTRALLANPGPGVGPEIYLDVPGGVALTPLRADAIAVEGGGQAHENQQPSLAVYYCIAVQGLWPPRS